MYRNTGAPSTNSQIERMRRVCTGTVAEYEVAVQAEIWVISLDFCCHFGWNILISPPGIPVQSGQPKFVMDLRVIDKTSRLR